MLRLQHNHIANKPFYKKIDRYVFEVYFYVHIIYNGK